MASKNNGAVTASNRGRFYGVGRNKAGRRSNSPAGSRANRKYYAYVREDQKGTPMARFIDSNYAGLDEQFNAMRNHPNGLKMKTNEATGKVGSIWSRVSSRMTKGNAISKYIDKHGGTAKGAASKLNDISGSVSFGADPKSK